MDIKDVLKKVVVSAVTLLTTLSTAYFTVLLLGKGELGGAACTGLLTAFISYFVYRDAKMLLGK